MPCACISCEKLIQLRALLITFWGATVVPYPFLRMSSPSNTSRLMACRRVLREMFSSLDSSTSLGSSLPLRYSSCWIIRRSRSSACWCSGLEEFGSSCNFMSFGLLCYPRIIAVPGSAYRMSCWAVCCGHRRRPFPGGLSPESFLRGIFTLFDPLCSPLYLVYVLIFVNMFMQINVKYPNCQNLCSR